MELARKFIETILNYENENFFPDVIFDIGSRDLDQSIEFSKAFPNSRIIAFEPIPEQYQICLEKSKNYHNIEVHNIALSETEGEIDFWVVDGNIGASSLLEPIKIPYGNWEYNTWNKIKVKTETLDSFVERNNIESVNCIWMDVQGYELNVLKGGVKTLKTVDYMHTEASPEPYYVGHCEFEKLREFIINNGFGVTFNYSGHVYGEGDFICIKNKKRYKDFSLLLQGPIDDKSKLDFMNSIDYYKSLFSEIIVSTYTEHLAEDWRFQQFCEDHAIKIVHDTINIGEYINQHSIYYQTYTTLNGLKSVTKKYVLKHRLDERYSNLHLLLDKFLNDTNKLVTGGTFFGQKVYYEYHAGDHLMVSKTDNLIYAFEKTLHMIKNNILEPGPEIMYTKNFIRSYGENPTSERHDELMKKYVDFLPDRYMDPFVIRANHWNQLWTHKDSLGKVNSFETIDDMINSEIVILNQFY